MIRFMEHQRSAARRTCQEGPFVWMFGRVFSNNQQSCLIAGIATVFHQSVFDNLEAKLFRLPSQVQAIFMFVDMPPSIFSSQFIRWFQQHEIAASDAKQFLQNGLFSSPVGFDGVGCKNRIHAIICYWNVFELSNKSSVPNPWSFKNREPRAILDQEISTPTSAQGNAAYT